MPARQLDAADIAFPAVPLGGSPAGDVFSLSSHTRARQALEFGLNVADPGFNVFVVGEDRSGRMTATMKYLESFVEGTDPSEDWIYLNNFRRFYRPTPLSLPAGGGRRFRDRIALLVRQLREGLATAFGGDAFQAEVRAEGGKLQQSVGAAMEVLRAQARAQGIDIVQTPQGPSIVSVDGEGKPVPPETLSAEERERRQEAAREIGERMAVINRQAVQQQAELGARMTELYRQAADNAIAPLFDAVQEELGGYTGAVRWLVEMHEDVLENLPIFGVDGDEDHRRENPESRYAVNLLVDHSDDKNSGVLLEANPTYENLFGRIEYRPTEGGLNTDFSMIRAGSMHRANGGILVLRADALARNPVSWDFLKSALRDREIRIEELQRTGSTPLAGAPQPKAIPLDLKVVIVGAPLWYYSFFSVDPDFQTYFKIKAEIDADMDATPANAANYAALIRNIARDHRGFECDDAAVQRLLGIASRWAAHRGKLTARFEMIDDVVIEAVELAHKAGQDRLSLEMVILAVENRRRRNARVEDRMQESIHQGQVMIDTDGRTVGQVNALTVRQMGDHAFGGPSRITARASVGRMGVINIERSVAMGGPIQQKGVMVLQGFLSGHFARRFPLSFNCSITFEQNYGGVEGDSASLAELLAILSDLSGLSLRQDLAITGSINQRGEAQAIGGAHHKIEGFFRTCRENGPLTGTQGVIVPASNEQNLILRDDVAAAVAAGEFHIWSVRTIDEAAELFMETPAGEADADGNYPPDSIFGRVVAQLETFDRALFDRESRIRS
ncbi:MAG: AAA family ATPase [Proteobacteria bacterium]|nr:AAA family ATPase [Pseudomonadota bacterium]